MLQKGKAAVPLSFTVSDAEWRLFWAFKEMGGFKSGSALFRAMLGAWDERGEK